MGHGKEIAYMLKDPTCFYIMCASAVSATRSESHAIPIQKKSRIIVRV